MAEASALISLVTTAAHLSRVIIEIGTKYKNAKTQIESFGRELGILSKILDQLRRLLTKDALSLDMSFHVLATEIIDECGDMFSQLHKFKEKLYSNSTSQNVTWRGRTKWVFEAAELDYLRARVDSMKVNLLLMMTFQTISGQQGLVHSAFLTYSSTHLANERGVEDLKLQNLRSIRKAFRSSQSKAMPAFSGCKSWRRTWRLETMAVMTRGALKCQSGHLRRQIPSNRFGIQSSACMMVPPMRGLHGLPVNQVS